MNSVKVELNMCKLGWVKAIKTANERQLRVLAKDIMINCIMALGKMAV
jgi:hypothetical protein